MEPGVRVVLFEARRSLSSRLALGYAGQTLSQKRKAGKWLVGLEALTSGNPDKE